MKRWQMERPLMIKRWRREWRLHDSNFGTCHCGRGMGTMRKHKPGECPASAEVRFFKRYERRWQRRAGRYAIDEGLEDTSFVS